MASRSPRVGLALWVLAAAGCFNAAPDEVAGGGGVETTEGNVASLGTGLDGPEGARVTLIPADFDPLRDRLPGSLTVLADAKGRYRFSGLAPGRYNLEAYLPSRGTRCFRPGVLIAEGDRNIAGTDTLAAPGRLRLRWEGARRGVLTQKGRLFRLDLTGMETDSGGITLDSLPPGLLPPFSFTNAVDSATRLWTDSVRIAPGLPDSVPIREEWAHSAVLTWDTSLVTPDSLVGYPLLLRLASPDFPFSEASPGGADLRFTTGEGAVLRHTVEGWDSAAGHAEIWVRLNAPPGGGFGSLRMDWGNPAAVPRTGSVFASALGYAGVWHLDENPSVGPGLLEDAGPFALPTSSVGLAPRSQGAIGTAQRFDGVGAYASAAAVGQAQTPAPALLCVSAWIAPDTAGMLGRTPPVTMTILSDWDESDSTGFILAYLPDSHSVLLTLGFGATVTRLNPLLLENSGVAWHLVGATYDGTEAAVYLDGTQASTRPAGPGDAPLPSREFLIGAREAADPKAAKSDFFRGDIDEARVFRSVPGRAWLNLDFRAQKPGSQLFRFQRQR